MTTYKAPSSAKGGGLMKFGMMGVPRVLMAGAAQKKVRRTDVRNKRFA
jgi:hypothetical protein